MNHGPKTYLVETIKVTLRCFCVHVQGEASDVALIGSRRSGSTLLMEMLASNQGIRSINQPLSLLSGPPHQAKMVGGLSSRYVLQLRRHDKLILCGIIEQLRTGTLKLDEPWRLWASDFQFCTDRLVMKITNGHYICDFLHEQGFQVIQFIRHPLHQAISCERNQWSDHLDDFLMCKDALEDSLTVPEFDCLMRVNKSGTAFEKLALTWILENLPFLRDESNQYYRIYYEDLVRDSEEHILQLSSRLSLDEKRMKRRLGRPSRSTKKLSERSTVEGIVGRRAVAELEKNHARVDEERKLALQRLLDDFSIDVYSASAVFPRTQPKSRLATE